MPGEIAEHVQTGDDAGRSLVQEVAVQRIRLRPPGAVVRVEDHRGGLVHIAILAAIGANRRTGAPAYDSSQ
jgi:hypothetical protein